MKPDTLLNVPNLCKNSSVLMVILVTELLVIALTLVVSDEDFFGRLGVLSLYFQWIVLLTTACLCLFRNVINKKPYRFKIISIFFVSFIAFLCTEVIAQFLINDFSLSSFSWVRLFRYAGATAIIIGFVLRFFVLLGVLERRGKVELEQRIQALQSRIQPHFLFNSLNTISELTVTAPEQAEKAIQALSLLFRASLETVQKTHSLQAELDLCQRYLELEKWRLGDNLSVQQSVNVAEPTHWFIPKLILQPLIENAVNHGASSSVTVKIKVDVKETAKFLSILIENPVYQTEKNTKGNGMAVDNIKERLFVLYDDQQSFKVRDDGKHFQVIIRIPKQTQSKASNVG